MTALTMWTARTLLGRMLQEGREVAGRSPEAVATVTGISGKTIRRLEEGETARPRPVTLDSLAGFYALDAAFLRQLAEWDELAGEELSGGVRELAVARLGPLAPETAAEADDPLLWLAMRLGTAGASRPREEANGSGRGELLWGLPGTRLADVDARTRAQMTALLEDLLALDPRRRELVTELVADMRAAQERGRDYEE